MYQTGHPAAMGYDVTRFTDQPVDGEFLCSICLGVFEDPLQSPCGHVYCSACIKNWLIPGLPIYRVDPDFWPDPQQPVLDGVSAPGPSLPVAPQHPGFGRPNIVPSVNPRTCCPMDKRPLTRSDLTPIPLPLKAILSKLEIRCGFESCSYKCPLSDLATHESTCEYNPSSEVTCPKCSRRMARSERTNHDCIEVLKEVVEKLEREVEKLRKKRKFPNTSFGPFSAHGTSISLGTSVSLGTSASLGTSVSLGASGGRDGIVPLSNAGHQYYGPTAFGPPGIVRGTNNGAEGQPIMMGEPSLRPSIAPTDPPAGPSGHIVHFHHRNRNGQGQMYQEGPMNHSVIRRSLNHNHPYHHARSPMSPPAPRHGDSGDRSDGTVSRMTRYRPPHMRHNEDNGQSSASDWEPAPRSHMRQLRVVPPPPLSSPLSGQPGPSHTPRNSSPRNSGLNYSPRNSTTSPRNLSNSPRTSHSPRGSLSGGSLSGGSLSGGPLSGGARAGSESGAASSNHHQVVAMDGSMIDFAPDLEFIH